MLSRSSDLRSSTGNCSLDSTPNLFAHFRKNEGGAQESRLLLKSPQHGFDIAAASTRAKMSDDQDGQEEETREWTIWKQYIYGSTFEFDEKLLKFVLAN